MMNRLKLIGSDVVGYIYNRAPMASHLARNRRKSSSASPMGPPVTPPPPAAKPMPALGAEAPVNGESRPSLQSRPLR
jgi:hypothetical protein